MYLLQKLNMIKVSKYLNLTAAYTGLGNNVRLVAALAFERLTT